MSTLKEVPASLGSKTCLITGGAGALGKVVAEAFLRAGASVVICDIHKERLSRASEELASLGSLTAFLGDITSQQEVHRLFDDIEAKLGKLDILVNNAGIADQFQPVGDLDIDEWHQVISTNLTAPMLLSRLAVRSMLDGPDPGGCIINMASAASKAGMIAGAAYTASKHGLLGLTKHTAAFYGDKGIGCVALLLGLMPESHMSERMTNVHPEGWQLASKIMSANDMKAIKMESVAGFCVSLAKDNCRLCNGASISADGGFTCVLG
ncbi:short chain dehydrogenase/oxidoreductase [Colletotrichum somersetense]|nr:short chain dehydrogenase/oxidoreductase [Colletotrichum somersetense]